MDVSSPCQSRKNSRLATGKPVKYPDMEKALATSCFLDECDEPRVRNQKWCEAHKRAYAAMYAAAKKRDDVESFKEIMSDDDRCKGCMRAYCQKNPIGARWARKKIIDYAEYSQTYGRREYEGDHEGDRPMTEFQFLHWAKETMRLTDAGARAWWQELENSNCDRDQKGRDPNGKLGETRLWVPSDEMRERKKGRYADSQVQEKSKQLKNLDEEALNQLKDFASMRAVDAEFLRGKRLAQAQEANPELPLKVVILKRRSRTLRTPLLARPWTLAWKSRRFHRRSALSCATAWHPWGTPSRKRLSSGSNSLLIRPEGVDVA